MHERVALMAVVRCVAVRCVFVLIVMTVNVVLVSVRMRVVVRVLVTV